MGNNTVNTLNITDNPNIKLDLGNDEYHARPEISKSQLDLLAKSPAHFKSGFRKETGAMQLGMLVHTAILEPELFEKSIIAGPDYNKNTKKWKDFVSKNVDREVIKPVEMARILDMRLSVMRHPTASKIFDGGLAESSIFGQLEGVPCRCRPDYLINGFCVDLKTTRDASHGSVTRSVHQYRYHVQAAFYLDVIFSAGIKCDGFVFVFVETEPPFGVGCYILDQSAIERGRELYVRNLETYKNCESNNQWSAYSDQIETIGLPEYSYYEEH